MQDKMSNIMTGENLPFNNSATQGTPILSANHFASDEKYDTCHTVWHCCECAHHTNSFATSLL